MLSDILDYLSGTLDKPGRAVRGVLGGHPEELGALVPFSDSLGLTDPANRVSGTALAKDWFGLSPDDLSGKAAGFGLEMALDPTNYLGLGLAGKAARGAAEGVSAARMGTKEAQAAIEALNADRATKLAKGYMPEEIARTTAAFDPTKTANLGSGAFDHPAMLHSMPEFSQDSFMGVPYRYTNPVQHEASQQGLHTLSPESIAKSERDVNALRSFPTPEAGEEALRLVNNVNADFYLHRSDNTAKAAMLDRFLSQDVPLNEHAQEMIDRAIKNHEFRTDLMQRVAWEVGDEVSRANVAKIHGVARTYPGMQTERSFVDARNPLNITDIEAENPAHPDVRALRDFYRSNIGMSQTTREASPELTKWLGERGYDSLVRHDAEGSRYLVPSTSQVYKPWLAPAEIPIPADYSGPSMAHAGLRAAATPLGALSADILLKRRNKEDW